MGAGTGLLIWSQVSICAEPTLVAPDRVMLTNTTGFTRHLDEGIMVGVAEKIKVLSET